jgi:hypothetical protein
MRYVIPGAVLYFTLLGALAPLSGATIPVFGTGLNAAGQFLAPGTADPHYTLTVNYLGTGSNPVVPDGANSSEAAAQAVPVGWPLVPGVWASDPNAQWISPTVDVVGIPGVGMDTFYTYQTTFDLSAFETSTVQLSGEWTADNYLGEVLLNGNPIFTSDSCIGSGGAFAFQSLSPFSISSGFVSGVNTLTFDVTNSVCLNTAPLTNPTGLFVDISGTGLLASGNINPLPSPEPGSALPVAVGLALAACLYWRRHKVRA